MTLTYGKELILMKRLSGIKQASYLISEALRKSFCTILPIMYLVVTSKSSG